MPLVGASDWHVLIRFKTLNDTHSRAATATQWELAKKNSRVFTVHHLKTQQPKNLYHRLSDLDVWVSWTRLFYRLSIINRILCRAFFILCWLNDFSLFFPYFSFVSFHQPAIEYQYIVHCERKQAHTNISRAHVAF